MWRRFSVAMAVTSLVAIALAPAATGARSTTTGSDEHGAYVKSVLVRGAPIHGSNGLAIDTRGRLLVASALGGELVAVQPRTGHILARLAEETGVDSPDDVAVGPDGSIYWTDIQIGEVGRLAPDGKVTKQKVALGMNPIAFSATGRLFVAQAFFGDGLYELDPNLVKPPRVVIKDSGPTGAPWPNQLNGFDFGPDGMLYSPQPFLGRIVRINPDTGAMTVVTNAFAKTPPTSVEFDSHGHLYASLVDGTIVRVNRFTGAYRVVTHIPHAVLDNMVFDARDRLYVSDSDNGAVYKIGLGGGIRTLVRGGLILPGGIAMTKGTTGRDALFVANVWSLVEIDPQSGTTIDVDEQSRAGGGIVTSWSVAPDGPNVDIASWMANAVQIWDPIGDREVKTFTNFAVPINAIRFQGDLVVAALGTGSVVRQNATTGAVTDLATGLKVPGGLAATKDDLWVADWATGTVWQIVKDGAVLTQPMAVATGLKAPEGMAVDHDGSLLVVETGAHRLARIDLHTGKVSTVADGLAVGLTGSTGAPPTYALSSVAVGRDGTLYVTGDVKDVIYRLQPVDTD